jgi:outer membrane immunogenic protein
MASVAFAPVAHAADLGPADKTSVLAPAPAGVNWTGFYIGGNVGYAHSTYSASDVTGTASAGMNVGGVPLPLGSGTVGLPSVGAGNGSFTGGGQIGFNYQIGPTVLGLEADFQGANLNGSLDSNSAIDLGVGPVGINSSVSLKTDWYATVRGRIGHPFGAFLPYVTGGLAIAGTKAQVTNSTTLTIPGFGNVGGSASDSVTKTLTGYAVGAGLEYALGHGWSIKGEYLHLGFGNQSYGSATPFSGSLGAGISVSGTTAVHADLKADFDIARVGVNYRF